jgi:hypothetical protein
LGFLAVMTLLMGGADALGEPIFSWITGVYLLIMLGLAAGRGLAGPPVSPKTDAGGHNQVRRML